MQFSLFHSHFLLTITFHDDDDDYCAHKQFSNINTYNQVYYVVCYSCENYRLNQVMASSPKKREKKYA